MIYKYMKNFKKAFTLIELLIVIALLGALAIGLMAALDPFEQLKKGTDTGVRNTAAELQGAGIRFYAVKGNVPWCNPALPVTDGNCPNPISTHDLAPGAVVSATAFNTVAYNTAVDQIVTSGELKSNFVTLSGSTLDKLYVTGNNGLLAVSAEFAVCFKPQSKSFQADKNTKYRADGTTDAAFAAGCKSQNIAGVDCFYCIQ